MASFIQSLIAWFKKWYSKPMPEPTPVVPLSPIPIAEPEILSFDTQKHAYHAVRVMCDNAGLSLAKTIQVGNAFFAPKDIMCACIYQESQFYNYLPSGLPTQHKNLNKNGTLSSTDWGICQINDYFHVEAYHDFPSVDFIMQNPDKAVAFMIHMYQAKKLGLWDSYFYGGYKTWLEEGSPMWALRQG